MRSWRSARRRRSKTDRGLLAVRRLAVLRLRVDLRARDLVRLRDVRIDLRARPLRARRRRAVDGIEAEARTEAGRPLEVVEERPVEVAAHVEAVLLHRFPEREEVLEDEARAVHV